MTFSQAPWDVGDFHGHFLGGVVEEHHVVGVPTHRARHVHRHLVEEQQQRRELVGHVLGGMEVAQIQQIVHAGVRGGVGQVELVGAHGHRLQTDAEHLRLAGVDDAVVLLGV